MQQLVVGGLGWASSLSRDLGDIFLEIKDRASPGAGPSIYVRGKMQSDCFVALQLREWESSSPPTKKPSRAMAWGHID